MAEKMSSDAFLTISLEMCAELHFPVVLLALRSRAAFQLAAEEKVRTAPKTSRCPRHWEMCWCPGGTLHQHSGVQPHRLRRSRCAYVWSRSTSHLPRPRCGARGCSRGFAPTPLIPSRCGVLRGRWPHVWGAGCGWGRTGCWGLGGPVPLRKGRKTWSLPQVQATSAAASTKKHCRVKPHSFSTVGLAWARVCVPADTLCKMHHHNGLSVSYATPSTFPLTFHHCCLSQLSLERVCLSIFTHPVFVFVFQHKLFIQAHKSTVGF